MWSKVNEALNHGFADANKMSIAMGEGDIQKPRSVERQILRENHPAENAQEYYKHTTVIPFLDYLSRDLKESSSHADLATDGLSLLPECLLQGLVTL